MIVPSNRSQYMELYLTDLTDPIAFIDSKLAQRFHTSITKDRELLVCGGMFDKKLFEQFRSMFNCISITSGITRGDYGQTAQFSYGENPKLDEMEWRDIPKHLIGEALLLSPTEMSGRYGYRRKEDIRSNTHIVEEFFFFEFLAGYSPETFSKFSSSLSGLRYLSSTLHKLDSFKVILVEKGVYVSIRARISDSHKPAFVMNC
jgi:hypothetical protein